MKNIPEPPKFPLSIIYMDPPPMFGYSGDRCPKCHSMIKLSRWFFGKKIGCIQPECSNYWKK